MVNIYPDSRDTETRSRSGGGRRRAICIGINRYSRRPLRCCVADAKAWGGFFRNAGFELETITDHEATRARILREITDCVASSRAGDVIAIQYSGHGTSIARSSGDERTDEALVPIDFDRGAYIIDDDLAEINDRIPEGVNVTYFMDCCHSGTITRSLMGVDLSGLEAGVEVRYMPVRPDDAEAHSEFRRQIGRHRASPYAGRSEVLFAACKPSELSYESNGSGHFTRHSLSVLRGGASGLTNASFIDRVRQSFGTPRRQNPALWSDEKYWQSPLLGSRSQGSTEAPGGSTGSGSGSSNLDRIKAALENLRSIADDLP